ncbi:DUF5627 domain-containing protein [Flavisolibacter nicotianae]|uniref:DUF5627 domain-containing protein n=1 Tax=Flavisolibacter nicotianae TaxID=2364882 RepID=UPI000EAEE3D4|nr:DUF5627 domain-containing protein [Flavisolibacter nicotianae]
MKRTLLIASVLLTVLTACNKDWEFPDYKYTTVYFPYQSPVRTLVLGEDIYDNTLDNQHKFLIMATMGGVYENKKNITLNLEVDEALGQHLKFETPSGDSVFVLPSNYYTLPKDKQIVIPSGKLMGGIEVQLTDAFFQDPRSIKNTFVIPLRIASVTGADSVLRGRTELASPDRRKPGDWVIAPKDFTLYAIKYINPYHGSYLRRGVDVVTGAGGNTALDTNFIYHAPYVEKDQVVSLATRALDENSVTLTTRNKGSNLDVPFQLVLKFDNQGKVTVSNPATATYTITGNGEFVKKGDMWGNQQRDVLHLKYQVNFGTTVHTITDTIVIRDRGVKMETFNPVVVN